VLHCNVIATAINMRYAHLGVCVCVIKNFKYMCYAMHLPLASPGVVGGVIVLHNLPHGK
jgi:hypothetical protein